ncbi:MAG: PLP-dependent aminotransferase family protein [Oscillospiraceae bacterium]|nr:PLP-dependent aminotransferase family protein [Oscillospiraceae bacterium]
MKTGGPAYLRLYERLRREIIDGSWPFGARLPSKRQLAEEEGVSVVTAEHAYALLCDEGYLEARERSGYYVLFRETDGFLPAETSRRSLPMPAEERPDFPFSVLARTMRRVLSEYQEGLMERCPNQGTEALRRAIARYLGRSRGIHVSPEQIWIGAGAEYLYGLIVQALGRERIYAAEDPSYEKIRRVYAAHGAECRLLPLGPDGIRSEALAASDASVLHITPYRSYPSNITASAAKRREYIRWAAVPGRYVVEDDFASEFTTSSKPEETVFSLSERGNVIYMNTFSRTVAPSLRMGYLVLSEELGGLFAERVGFYACTVPVFEQFVLAEFMESGDYERHIRRARRALRRGSGK